MTFFPEKFPFSRRKFLMTFFVIDQVFKILHFFTVLQMSDTTLSSQEKPLYFRKQFLDNTMFFTLFILSRASDNTISLNIRGDQSMGRPPPQIFGGPSPQFPLGLRPWSHNLCS